MSLLLLSNSTSPGYPYLAHARDWIAGALGDARSVVFVPYAGVTVSYEAYADRVREALGGLGVEVVSLHEAPSPERAIAESDAVLVGGGNTFHLLRELHLRGLVGTIRRRVEAGATYVGWSAGANVACPTIRTTNDMPIVEPPSLGALSLVPVQINPHYTNAHPAGHQGETRAQRLAEFVVANPGVPVVGLPEGTGLRIDAGRVGVLGGEARLFDEATPEGRPVTEVELQTVFAP